MELVVTCEGGGGWEEGCGKVVFVFGVLLAREETEVSIRRTAGAR
jgi:hypothetical protein